MAPAAALDASVASGEEMRFRQSSSAEALATRVVGGSDSRRSAPFGARLDPAADVVPSALIARIVTENGVLIPPLRGRQAGA
jgi:methylthioribose-1-phosphate isomerase